jgi:twitching motility two-component system response regulator PilG
MTAPQAKSNAFLSGFALASFLQLLNMEQKTCTLMVKSKEKVGYLYIRDGELVNARTEGIEGEKAATRIISWKNTETEVEDICHTERKVNTPLMHILLNSSRLEDENGPLFAVEELLDEAVRMAEGRHFKKAKLLLTRVLKLDSRNYKAWLWFSRISESLKAVEATLKNAAKIAPEDQEVADEIRKYKKAKNRSVEEPFPRCPFCWYPLGKDTIKCSNCKSHLLIHTHFFELKHFGDKSVLKEAIKRYTRVTEREKNFQAHYWLGMAYLNVDKSEEALNHLDLSAKFAPNDQYYSDQLNILLKHLASTRSSLSRALPTGNSYAHEAVVPLRDKLRRKILVVEDSSTTRKVIAVTLGQKGYEIIEAGDGLEALSKLNEVRPNLILLDIILPKMDGYKILSIIKENPEFGDIPVIMLTSKDGILNKVKGKVAGSAAYLTKPFDPSQLVETIEKHIN